MIVLWPAPLKHTKRRFSCPKYLIHPFTFTLALYPSSHPRTSLRQLRTEGRASVKSRCRCPANSLSSSMRIASPFFALPVRPARPSRDTPGDKKRCLVSCLCIRVDMRIIRVKIDANGVKSKRAQLLVSSLWACWLTHLSFA